MSVYTFYLKKNLTTCWQWLYGFFGVDFLLWNSPWQTFILKLTKKKKILHVQQHNTFHHVQVIAQQLLKTGKIARIMSLQSVWDWLCCDPILQFFLGYFVSVSGMSHNSTHMSPLLANLPNALGTFLISTLPYLLLHSVSYISWLFFFSSTLAFLSPFILLSTAYMTLQSQVFLCQTHFLQTLSFYSLL